MLMTHIPEMLVSEQKGWSDIDRTHSSHRWYFTHLVIPLSLVPPLMFAWAETMAPGAVFPLIMPALSSGQLLAHGVAFFLVQLAMVTYMAMLIQRTAMARDHDPGYDSAYALAAIAPVPLWLGSLGLFIPSLGANLAIMALAWLASVMLIRHGTRPLLHIDDAKTAHYVANMVTFAGVVAWVGLMVIMGLVMGMVVGR